MLNKRGPKIEPCGAPDFQYSPMNCKNIQLLFFVFDSEGNLEFSKQEVTVHKHVVLQLISHGKYNQILSIGQ